MMPIRMGIISMVIPHGFPCLKDVPSNYYLAINLDNFRECDKAGKFPVIDAVRISAIH